MISDTINTNTTKSPSADCKQRLSDPGASTHTRRCSDDYSDAEIFSVLDCFVMDFLSRKNEGANHVRIDKFTAIFAGNTYASL